MPRTDRKFEDILAEMREQGLDESYADELSKAWQASPLRQAAETAAERARKAETALLRSTFKELGISVKPDHLRLPDDLDPTDSDRIKAFAVDAGLLTPDPEPTPDPAVTADLQAQQRITAATAGAGEVNPDADFQEALNQARNEREVMAVLERFGRTEVRVT